MVEGNFGTVARISGGRESAVVGRVAFAGGLSKAAGDERNGNDTTPSSPPTSAQVP